MIRANDEEFQGAGSPPYSVGFDLLLNTKPRVSRSSLTLNIFQRHPHADTEAECGVIATRGQLGRACGLKRIEEPYPSLRCLRAQQAGDQGTLRLA